MVPRNARPSMSLALAVGFGLAPSCGKSSLNALNPSEPGVIAAAIDDSRLRTVDSEVLLAGVDTSPTLVEDKLALTFKYVAQLKPPLLGDTPLQATHFASSGDDLFIVYNKAGAEFGGALDVVNLHDLAHPKHLASLHFKDTEFAAVAVEGEYAFLVGARDLDRPGAVLLSVRISNRDKPEVVGMLELGGYYATAIRSQRHLLQIAVGDQTGVVTVDVSDPSKPMLSETQKLTYATDLFRSGSNTYVLGGESGSIYRLESDAMKAFVNLTHAPFESPARAVADRGTLFSTAAMTSSGESRLQVVDESTAEIVATVPLKGRGNGLDVHGRYLFLAQGEAGAQVFDVRHPAEPSYLGAFDFKGDAGSANQIQFAELSSKDVLLLGDGSGGLRIVSFDSRTQFNAKRFYHPTEFREGELRRLRGPIQFRIPRSLRVTAGNASNGLAVMRFDTTECTYQGASQGPSPSVGSLDWKRGLRYQFVKCSNGAHPGRGVIAREEVELKLVSAHSGVPMTSVRVSVKSF